MNRFSQISTSAFDPLSLNEVMAIPLAKQKQHDEMLAAASKIGAIDSQRLAADEEIVASELDRVRQKSADLSNEILQKGFDRSSKNRFNELKRDTELAFSQEGILGRAKAQYDKRQANVKSIMDSKTLSEQQKSAGLNKAMNDYKGIENGRGYQDYIGADKVDVQALALDVGSKMKPQELADSLPGWSYDPLTKLYSDGTYHTKSLPPEEISRAVGQYLMNDEGVASYVKDLQQIGLITDPVRYIQNASINAGNILKVSDMEQKRTLVPQWAQDKALDDSKLIDTRGWTSKTIQSLNMELDEDYKMDVDNDDLYDDNGNYIPVTGAKEGEEGILFNIPIGGFMGPSIPGDIFSKGFGQRQKIKKQQDDLALFRSENPEFDNLSDRELGEFRNELLKNSESYYSEVRSPMAMKDTFHTIKDNILGAPGQSPTGMENVGDINTRDIHLPGKPGVRNFEGLARELDMDQDELLQNMKAGKMLGFAPANPNMPFGYALQFYPEGMDEGDSAITIMIQNTEFSDDLGESSHLSKNLLAGKRFEVEETVDAEGNKAYNNYVLELDYDKDENGRFINPRYNAFLVLSSNKYENLGDLEKDYGSQDVLKMPLSQIIDEDSKLYQSKISSITQKNQ